MQDQIIDSTNSSRRAESTTDTWRLFLKALIKTGLSIGRSVGAVGRGVYSEASKIVAEARAELDRDEKAKAGTAEPGASTEPGASN